MQGGTQEWIFAHILEAEVLSLQKKLCIIDSPRSPASPSPYPLPPRQGEVFRGSSSLIRGRGEFLPFRSQSFEGVVLSLMIHENPPLLRRAILKEALRVIVPRGTVLILDYHRTSRVLGRMAGMMEYAIEWAAGKDHFRNYRLFMEEGALAGFLAHLSPEKIRWQPVFFDSMVLVGISAGGPLSL